jgi:hypothetical protein
MAKDKIGRLAYCAWLDAEHRALGRAAATQAERCVLALRMLELNLPNPHPLVIAAVLRELIMLEQMLARHVS